MSEPSGIPCPLLHTNSETICHFIQELQHTTKNVTLIARAGTISSLQCCIHVIQIPTTSMLQVKIGGYRNVRYVVNCLRVEEIA
jgi:hypothetical protein